MLLSQINIQSPSTIFGTNEHRTLLGQLIGRVLLFAIPFAGLYFFMRLILSGYNYMTSLGDPQKISVAHQQIINSGFGLLIVFSAYFIAQIMQNILRLNFL